MKINNLLIVFISLALGLISIFYIFNQDYLIYSFVFFILMLGIFVFLQNKQLKQDDELTKEKPKKEKEYIDKLTSLPNRNKFFQDIEEAKGIILIDLDDFSILNTIYSKEFGDEFLHKLSAKLLDSKCIDNLYRMGGDEFAVISKIDTDLKSVANCLLDVIETFYLMKDNIMIQLTATISITYTTPLIETADLGLKYGKKNKLNLVVFSNNEDIFGESQTFLDITLRLKNALKSNNVVPFFQCIKNSDLEVVKYEALMRIKEGDKYLLPAVFLDIAKKTKIYPELTIQMVKKTFEYMKDKNVKFSLNLSFDDIINKRIYDFILSEIDKFPNSNNIIIELSEEDIVQNFDYVKQFVDKIRQKGVQVAVDGFGRDYSNFIYLERMKVDIIKIDGDLVYDILSSDNATFLVGMVVEFCQKNGITSIAEFVSHREIFVALKELGVDEYQGFYFCKPKESI